MQVTPARAPTLGGLLLPTKKDTMFMAWFMFSNSTNACVRSLPDILIRTTRPNDLHSCCTSSSVASLGRFRTCSTCGRRGVSRAGLHAGPPDRPTHGCGTLLGG
jgi:hypothetical protein